MKATLKTQFRDLRPLPFLLLLAAGIINAVGVTMFLAPVHLYNSGISGIGSGMTIRFGGAIDGIEVMAVIFSKRLGLTVGTFVMIYNVLLYITIGILFHSWVLPLYSIVTYCAAIKAVDFIAEGLDKAKSSMIVTSKAGDISEALSESFGRGITHIGAKGYYSGSDQTIIYFVANRF